MTHSPYDSLIIGAGINGLVTAAYLARAGMRVLVVDRRPNVGGAATTEEIAPGFRVDACAHDVGWLPDVVASDLELARHGLEMRRPATTAFTPLEDGRAVILSEDASATATALRAFSTRDAERWIPFGQRIARLAGFLRAVYSAPAPRVNATSTADLLTLLGLGRRLRGLGDVEMIELLRTVPMSVSELLDDWFETDGLKGTIAASGITGIAQGPRSGGTSFVMLHHHVGEPPCALRSRALPVGGAGALTAALASCARARGVEIRTSADVAQIVVRDGRAVGVALGSGEEILARRVVSSADPRRTFLALIDPIELDPEFVRAVQNVKLRGVSTKVNFALAELPAFTAARGSGGNGAGGISHLTGAISISPSLDYLERAYDDAKHGRVSAHPYLEARIPSLHDPRLAPAGKHVMSVLVQYAPYRLADGEWDDERRAALGDAVVDLLTEHAPNFAASVVARQVLTPADLERVYGLTEGAGYHGELTLDQILFMRPVPGWARYRTPILDLYLCGAGTHPGGGIAGMSGRLAARQILRDWRKEKP